MANAVLVSESTVVVNGRTVPFRRFHETIAARPQPKLRIIEKVQCRPPSTRPNSRTSPVKVTTSRGIELVFENHKTAWWQLKLPDNKRIKNQIECAFAGAANIRHGSVEYSFEFVEIQRPTRPVEQTSMNNDSHAAGTS